jgi:hypothetical protein
MALRVRAHAHDQLMRALKVFSSARLSSQLPAGQKPTIVLVAGMNFRLTLEVHWMALRHREPKAGQTLRGLAGTDFVEVDATYPFADSSSNTLLRLVAEKDYFPHPYRGSDWSKRHTHQALSCAVQDALHSLVMGLSTLCNVTLGQWYSFDDEGELQPNSPPDRLLRRLQSEIEIAGVHAKELTSAAEARLSRLGLETPLALTTAHAQAQGLGVPTAKHLSMQQARRLTSVQVDAADSAVQEADCASGYLATLQSAQAQFKGHSDYRTADQAPTAS